MKSPLDTDHASFLTASSFQEILGTIEAITGLEASVYPPEPSVCPAVAALPLRYRRHMSSFCRAVKNSRDGKGCHGHDSWVTTRRAGEVREPFVQICRAGIAEVIIPICQGREHLATICLGQAITEVVDEAGGFQGVWRQIASSGVDRDALKIGYEQLPHIAEERLLRIGRLLEAAVHGLADNMSAEKFAHEMRLQHAPAVRRAIDILTTERCLHISQQEMAARVHLSVSHFSRLFHRVTGKSFSDYLIALRMAEAQQLLHHTRIPISDIARRCGYSRQSYFTRQFRQQLGLTPSAYRHDRQSTA